MPEPQTSLKCYHPLRTPRKTHYPAFMSLNDQEEYTPPPHPRVICSIEWELYWAIADTPKNKFHCRAGLTGSLSLRPRTRLITWAQPKSPVTGHLEPSARITCCRTNTVGQTCLPTCTKTYLSVSPLHKLSYLEPCLLVNSCCCPYPNNPGFT